MPATIDRDSVQLATYARAVVVHGADPDVPRPSGFAYVEWLGTVEPNNAEQFDKYTDIS